MDSPLREMHGNAPRHRPSSCRSRASVKPPVAGHNRRALGRDLPSYDGISCVPTRPAESALRESRFGVAPTRHACSGALWSALVAGRVFVGRERELETIRAAVGEAVSGRFGVVLIAGEPGVGQDTACGHGFAVGGRTRCDRGSRHRQRRRGGRAVSALASGAAFDPRRCRVGPRRGPVVAVSRAWRDWCRTGGRPVVHVRRGRRRAESACRRWWPGGGAGGPAVG